MISLLKTVYSFVSLLFVGAGMVDEVHVTGYKSVPSSLKGHCQGLEIANASGNVPPILRALQGKTPTTPQQDKFQWAPVADGQCCNLNKASNDMSTVTSIVY